MVKAVPGQLFFLSGGIFWVRVFTFGMRDGSGTKVMAMVKSCNHKQGADFGS